MTRETMQMITNTETKSVLLTPELEAELPGIEAASAAVDSKFDADRRTYLERLEESQFVVKSQEGPQVKCSLLMNEGVQSDELMIVFAPFADPEPKSDAETMFRFTDGDPKVSKGKAKPNSWSQTTKSAVTTDLLQALGHGMPVLTIYAPVPTGVYNRDERKDMRTGNFAAAGGLAESVLREAVSGAQARVHGINSPEQLSKLHISGASLGASNAIGAAVRLMRRDFEIASVTAQELVMSPENLFDLAKRFTFAGIVGEASLNHFPVDAPAIQEPALRRAIDAKGSEFVGMNLRMLQGASKLTYMKGMTKVLPTQRALETLGEAGVTLLGATADNSAMSDKTRRLVPRDMPQVHISAQEGAKLGHIVDEYVAVSSLVIALNVARARRERHA